MRTGVDNVDNLKRFGNYLTFWKNTKMSDKFLLFFFDPKYRHNQHPEWVSRMGVRNVLVTVCNKQEKRSFSLWSSLQSKIIAALHRLQFAFNFVFLFNAVFLFNQLFRLIQSNQVHTV